MKEKLLCLGTEESIIIFNEHCSEAIRISNHNNEIITSKIKNKCITILTIIKPFVIFFFL